MLPGIHGPELARRMQQAAPRLKTLFISGYTGEEQVPAGARFLAKPFTLASAARKSAGDASGIVRQRVYTCEHTVPAETLGIALGALGGAAVGVEREWSGHASGPASHFAGIRTFTLLGGLSGAAGWLWAGDFRALATVIVAGAVGLIISGYVAPAGATPTPRRKWPH